MNASELKIGDWVKDKNGNILKIAGIEQTSCSVWDNEENFVSDMFFDEFQPIPLTKDILKKNGWESSTIDWDWQFKFHSATLHAYFYHYGRGLNHELDSDEMKKLVCAISVSCNQDYVDLHDIHYVHELQHILWALGIDDNVQINN